MVDDLDLSSVHSAKALHEKLRKHGLRARNVESRAEVSTPTLRASGTVEVSARATLTSLRNVSAGIGPELKPVETGFPTRITKIDVVDFLLRAKGQNESLVRIAMYSDTTSFEDIGLHTGSLSENDARIALENFFEVRTGRRKFWSGFLAGLIGGVISALLVAWALYYFGPPTT